MAREYARVKVSIWADPDFRHLTAAAQGLYFQLISSPTMNLAGVADWRPKRLAALSAGSTFATVEANAAELAAHGYVVIDDDTEEILVRSFVRHDRLIATQGDQPCTPTTRTAAQSHATGGTSTRTSSPTSSQTAHSHPKPGTRTPR